MSFLHPALALWGTAAVAIPIIIHLLMRRRRKPFAWGAMRFLLEAYRRQRRRLQLEQLLLLAARCLLIAASAAAIAHPLLGGKGGLESSGPRTVHILLDNSLASSALDASGEPALARHVAAARKVLDQLDPTRGDRASLFFLGGPAEATVFPPAGEIGGVRAILDSARPTDSTMDLHGALSRLAAELNAESPTNATSVILLSDFLAGSVRLDSPLPVLPKLPRMNVEAAAPASLAPSNVSVVDVQPLRSVLIAADSASPEAGAQQVRVTLRRTGPGVDLAAATKVRMRVQGKGGAAGVVEQIVRWNPGEGQASASVLVPATTSAGQAILIAEIDRDAVDGDNTARRGVQVRDRFRVAVVTARADRREGEPLDPEDPAAWIRLALTPTGTPGGDEDVEIATIDPASIDGPRLARLDAVIVASPDRVSDEGWRRIAAFCRAQGVVIVVPPADVSVHVWTDAFKNAFALDWTIAREPVDHPEPMTLSPSDPQAGRGLLSLVSAELGDLVRPVSVFRSLPVEAPPGQLDPILELGDGSPLVAAGVPRDPARPEGGPSSGLVVLIASSLSIDWTDLPSKPLFVPLMQELVRSGASRAWSAPSEVAGCQPVLPAGAVEVRRADAGSLAPVGPSLRADASSSLTAPIRSAGLYAALDARGVAVDILPVNADPEGGRMEVVPAESITAWLSPALGEVAMGQTSKASSSVGDADDDRIARGDSTLVAILFGAAAALGLVELVLARWFSRAGVSTPRAQGAGA